MKKTAPDPDKGRITARKLSKLIHVTLHSIIMDLLTGGSTRKPNEYLNAREVMLVLRAHSMEYEPVFGVFRPLLKT